MEISLIFFFMAILDVLQPHRCMYVCVCVYIYIYSGTDSFTECLSPHNRGILHSNLQPKLEQSWHSGISREAVQPQLGKGLTCLPEDSGRSKDLAITSNCLVQMLPSPSSFCSLYNRPMNPRNQELRKGTWLTEKMAD